MKKVALAIAGACGLIVILGLVFGLVDFSKSEEELTAFRSLPPPSPSRLGKYKKAAVSSDHAACSDIGRDVMLDGGNAIDAAVAVLFCIGVMHPQSSGIGGGFLMTIYNSTSGTARCLNAREMAPLAATEDMYQGNSNLSKKGALAVAVPGELAGSWAVHQAYGRLPWSRLVLPSSNLAEKGVTVNNHLANALKLRAGDIKKEPSLRTFLNQTTGEVLQEGDIFKRSNYSRTLSKIAEHGSDIFYKGSIGDQIVADIQQRGGIITKQDLLNYQPEWIEAIKVDLKKNLSLFTLPLPGSGALLAYIINILDGRLVSNSSQVPPSDDPLTYHRIAEAFKHGYAQRTKLGDPSFEPDVLKVQSKLLSKEFASEAFDKIFNTFTSNDPTFYEADGQIPDDHGTTHISILDGNGIAVAVTASVNFYLGAGFSTGESDIILNDQMDDFSTPNVNSTFGAPPNPSNFIRPGKRPLSSMTPSVVTHSNNGQIRMVIGAAGGTRIPTGVFNVMARNLWFGESIKEAIDKPRIHHQVYPMVLQYENGLTQAILKNLTAKGHKLYEFTLGSVVTGITVENGTIYANADFRKRGDVAGIDPVN